MCLRVISHTFWAHKLEADTFGAEVSDGLPSVFVAGDIIVEVGLHVFKIESSVHLFPINQINYQSRSNMSENNNCRFSSSSRQMCSS